MAKIRKSGCNFSSQKRQPALNKPTIPSPARTCGSTHQLGVSRAARIDIIPAPLGRLFTVRPQGDINIWMKKFGRGPQELYAQLSNRLEINYENETCHVP